MIESITNAVYRDAEGKSIDCMVKFKHLPEAVPFTARANDPEKHGRAIHAAILAGEAGSIGAYVPRAQQKRLSPVQAAELLELVRALGESNPAIKETAIYKRAMEART